MGWKGLERSGLDYILTDLLPVELSELFSYRPFYEFLQKKENHHELCKIKEDMKKQKSNGNALFGPHWASTPLNYNIMKRANSTRKMSLLQPISALNIWLFIECYQKEILTFFENNSHYSIRYHKKNSKLYYKRKSKKATHYFNHQSQRLKKGVIEQSGDFYEIVPFKSFNSLPDSPLWRMCNFEFKYYAKIDYNACFDSIYSHSYKWIIERNVIDSLKARKNSHLLITIDRVMQNMNGKSSNGLLVGPEFSRMIGEILFQHIDSEIHTSLSAIGYNLGRDYRVFRYVDDIAIFANSPEVVDVIISKYREYGEKFLLRLNDMKLVRGETPWLPKAWLSTTRFISDRISDLFYDPYKEPFASQPQETRYLVKSEHNRVNRIKDEITVLMSNYHDENGTIASFLLTTLLKKVSQVMGGFSLFGQGGKKKADELIDLAMFIYAYYPSFPQTRKIISIFRYINDEIDFKSSESAKDKLCEAINRYSFIFQKGNIFDLCDWFPFMREYCLQFGTKTEKALLEKIIESDNPIMWANMLLYSKYNQSLFDEVRDRINCITENHIANMTASDIKLYKEMWFILVFHNCPHIDSSLRNLIINKIQEMKTRASSPRCHLSTLIRLVCDFLQQQTGGAKKEESFFNWSSNVSIVNQITYRTYDRTIFRGYKSGIYASID